MSFENLHVNGFKRHMALTINKLFGNKQQPNNRNNLLNIEGTNPIHAGGSLDTDWDTVDT